MVISNKKTLGKKQLSIELNGLLYYMFPDSKVRSTVVRDFISNLLSDTSRCNRLVGALSLSLGGRAGGFNFLDSSSLLLGTGNDGKPMSQEELTNSITNMLRISMAENKVSDVKNLADIMDKLHNLYRPKSDKPTAININIINYSDYDDSENITGKVQEYTGVCGDDWLIRAWGLISSLNPRERIAWAKKNGVLPSEADGAYLKSKRG